MTQMMAGRRGLIMGVANDHSIAWGIAKRLASEGAELAFAYQGEHFGRRVKPLAASLGSTMLYPCDVEDSASMKATFEALGAAWGGLDFVVHAIAFSDKSELKGRYADTTRENFSRTMLISCFSFTEVARLAAPLMTKGGSLLTLTYGGSLRVNAISAGPVRTLAGAGVSDARLMFGYHRDNAPLRRSTTIEDVGGAGLYLLSDLSLGVSGEIHYVDCGYNILAMPRLDLLKTVDEKPTRDAAE